MPGFHSDNACSMFYSIYQANELKSAFEKEHDFKYDWVIRSRFDTLLEESLDLTKFNHDVINVPDVCFDPIAGCADHFAYSNTHNMDIYANVYDNLGEYLVKPNLKLCGEYILRHHLDNNNVPIRQIGKCSLFR
jgi:hypothetical protein